jgi:predicted DNA-binding protein (UPF0251 family)/predicted Fe-Mo cluster-binding NifX family protein
LVRPRKHRLVSDTPATGYFKPRGVPMKSLEELCLPVEGLEALRLSDVEGMNQEQAAKQMGVSRHTFGRVLKAARETVSRVVVQGHALRISGGDYRLTDEPCCKNSLDNQANIQQTARPDGGAVEVDIMSKVAISSEGPDLNDMVDPRFGRAAGFLVMDLETGKYEYLSNGDNQVRAQGAGIASAELMAKSGVEVLLTGYVGPKAFQALDAVGVKVGQDLEGISVAKALERYQKGEVTFASGPNR